MLMGRVKDGFRALHRVEARTQTLASLRNTASFLPVNGAPTYG